MTAARARRSPVRDRWKGRTWTQAPEIKITWPLSCMMTVFISSVFFTIILLSEETATSSGCGIYLPEHADCQHADYNKDVIHRSVTASIAKLNRLFLMWAVAVRFQIMAKWNRKPKSRVIIAIHTQTIVLLFFLETSAILLSWLLLSCGDIESNPGPTRRHIQRIQHNDSPNYYYDHDYTPFYSGMSNTMTARNSTSESLNKRMFSMAGYPQHQDSDTERKLECLCEVLQKDNDQLKYEVSLLANKCHILEEQCNNLFQWKDLFVDVAQKMDRHVDRLESFSRRNNVRFFNVYEGPNETDSVCIRKVVQLLNRFFPAKQWTVGDVERAHRVGHRKSDINHPRPIIARLSLWQDKLNILRAQDCRKEMANELGIRVASDLTDRQNQIIKEERDAGRHAYFWKGRLFYGKNRQNHAPSNEFNNATDEDVVQNSFIKLHNTDKNPEPVIQLDSVQNHYRKDIPLSQQNPCLSSDHLPWTADMSAFPPLPSHQADDSDNTPHASKGLNNQEDEAKMVFNRLTLRPVHDSASISRTGATLLSRDPPKPQRSPQTRGRTVINKWGISLVSSLDHEDALTPDSRAECSAKHRLSVSTSAAKAEHDTQAACQTSCHVTVASNITGPTYSANSSTAAEYGKACSSTSCPHGAPHFTAQHACNKPGTASPTQADPSTPPSPVTSPAVGVNTDTCQTFVKQLVDAWSAVDELESQSPINPMSKAGEKDNFQTAQHSVVKSDLQNFSLISETPKNQCRLTRSKTNARQQHVTECFPRVGTGSSRANKKEQPLNR